MKKIIYVVVHSVPSYVGEGDQAYRFGYSIYPHPMRAFYDEDDARAWIENHYKSIDVEFDAEPGGYSSGFLTTSVQGITHKIKYTIQEVVIS